MSYRSGLSYHLRSKRTLHLHRARRQQENGHRPQRLPRYRNELVAAAADELAATVGGGRRSYGPEVGRKRNDAFVGPRGQENRGRRAEAPLCAVATLR